MSECPRLLEQAGQRLKAPRGIQIRNKSKRIRALARSRDSELAPLRQFLGVGFPIFRGHPYRRNRAVRTDADMILAANLQCVLQVTNHIFRHLLSARAQILHEIDADYASFVGQLSQLLVGLVPRQISDRATTGVRDRDRLL